MKKKNKDPQVLIDEIYKYANSETIEGQLLRPHLIRALYKALGEPQEEDFKNEFQFASSWDKHAGYTKYIDITTPEHMTALNKSETRWCIKKPSATKVYIVEKYTRAGWSCSVQAFNVICFKYVKHPKYDRVWVEFYRSRDCAKYRYVLEAPDEQ